MKNVLTIAGSDCSGGAGIQADLKTFSAHGVYGMSVIISIVAENTFRVIDIQNIDTDIIAKQFDAIFEDIAVDAVKIGMLSNAECMKIVSLKLDEYRPKNIVIDPVMYAKNGSALMDPASIEAFKKYILPKADLLTPNLPEAEEIVGFSVDTKEDMIKAAKKIYDLGAKAVLLKGGHLLDSADDLLFDGKNEYWFSGERIPTKNTHGTGCTLSSSLASNLAKDLSLYDAVKESKEYVTCAIKHSLDIGHGNGPTNHFAQIYKKLGWL